MSDTLKMLDHEYVLLVLIQVGFTVVIAVFAATALYWVWTAGVPSKL